MITFDETEFPEYIYSGKFDTKPHLYFTDSFSSCNMHEYHSLLSDQKEIIKRCIEFI